MKRVSANGFEVDVVESHRFALRVNPMYTRLAIELRSNSASLSPEEKKHIQWYAGRARMFMANIKQRRQTILTITTSIVERQCLYLEHEVRSLLASEGQAGAFLESGGPA